MPQRSLILVLDDNDSIRRLFTAILAKEGYRTYCVGDAYDALAYLNSSGNGVSLIIADMVLPALSGFDFVAAMKTKPVVAHIPVIAVTGLCSPEDLQRAIDAGCATVIMKPVTARHLLEIVKAYLPKVEE